MSKILNNKIDDYYNKANSLAKLNHFEEAIEAYKKTLELNKNHYLAYFGLGNVFFKILNIEEAIYNFEKAIEINSNFTDAIIRNENARKERLHLISYLTYFNPEKHNNNSIIRANQKLQKIDNIIDQDKLISNSYIINLYNNIQEIIKSENINSQIEASQIYRKNKIDLNCKRHFEVFNTFNVIPEFCFGCYKIQVEPRNVLECLKLFIVFDNLNFKKNLTRKCMVETRPNVKGSYKGFIYCAGFEEAKKTLKKLNQILDSTISKNIPRMIKRGCSEYGIVYPEFKEIDPNSAVFMKYNTAWQSKEKIIDEELSRKKQDEKIQENSLSGITLKDGLIINNWLFYAKKIGDESVKQICNKIPYSPFMYKMISRSTHAVKL